VGQDQGFADLWRNAQQSRSAYLSLWFSLLWSSFNKDEPSVQVPAMAGTNEFAAEHEALPRAA
jgi:hypothetical protein